MEESEKAHELRIRSAERAHDWDMKGLESHTKQIEAFSLAGMRAPALVAAGGVAASLGFYSANYARLSGKQEALALFNASLSWLLVALLFTLVSPGLAYFSQLAYADSIVNHTHTWQHPFIETNRRSRIGKIVGDVFRWCAVASVVGAIVSVMIGGIKFLSLVATL